MKKKVIFKTTNQSLATFYNYAPVKLITNVYMCGFVYTSIKGSLISMSRYYDDFVNLTARRQVFLIGIISYTEILDQTYLTKCSNVYYFKVEFSRLFTVLNCFSNSFLLKLGLREIKFRLSWPLKVVADVFEQGSNGIISFIDSSFGALTQFGDTSRRTVCYTRSITFRCLLTQYGPCILNSSQQIQVSY